MMLDSLKVMHIPPQLLLEYNFRTFTKAAAATGPGGCKGRCEARNGKLKNTSRECRNGRNKAPRCYSNKRGDGIEIRVPGPRAPRSSKDERIIVTDLDLDPLLARAG